MQTNGEMKTGTQTQLFCYSYSFSGCTLVTSGFKDDFYNPYIRHNVFGTTMLLASVGGFLSLIGGISVISIFEILYFFGCKSFKKVEDKKKKLKVSQNCFVTFIKKAIELSSIHGLSNASEGKVFW